MFSPMFGVEIAQQELDRLWRYENRLKNAHKSPRKEIAGKGRVGDTTKALYEAKIAR